MTSEETTRHELLSNLLEKEELHDLTLKGNDGVVVSANRCILARSEVFERMLTGCFQEGSSSEVTISGYSGTIVQGIVEYIYSDHAKLLDGEDTSMERLSNLILLASAASYFKLPLLCKAVERKVSDLLQKTPTLCFSVLQICREQGPAAPSKIKLEAYIFLRHKISKTKITPNAVSMLSPFVLEKILKCTETEMDELQLFQILSCWYAAGSKDQEQDDRKTIATNLMKYIDLERIDPTDLVEKVEPSGLVSTEQLANTYKRQALGAKAEGHVFKKMRLSVCWRFSGSTTTTTSNRDLLKYPPIQSGVVEWTFEFQCSYCALGMASPTMKNSWSYVNNGVTFVTINDEPLEPFGAAQPFREGSKVTFLLNLKPQEGNGTLFACVDGGDKFQLFKDLRNHCKEGFVPSIGKVQHCPIKVSLVSIRRLED